MTEFSLHSGLVVRIDWNGPHRIALLQRKSIILTTINELETILRRIDEIGRRHNNPPFPTDSGG